ncbi:RNA polymerase factor sigma-54 [Candidatus Neptunichlamydia sp. REUL1]|uniref:RNA polymerase factor sigma-54 n=1 Tax=Candidatus Neptunichlamydia sp. REUL1 TaxID=3064277 RepID=UPI0029304E24|nr:RNA polymerase factor sigma-54 [Candidatus Neptunochlamydia sp. REUL1]
MGRNLHFSQCIQQDQHLIMSVAMERAFHVLQLPTEELSDWLEQEIEQNPVLDLPRSPAKEFDPSSAPSKPSLYDHLLFQIAIHFTTEEEKEIAHYFAGSLNSKGMLTLSKEEVKGKEKVLHVFQRMEPRGVGARSVQEALLIQLEEKNHSLAYSLVSNHYDDLLHLRLQKIAKEMHLTLSKVKAIIHKQIRPLNPFPANGYQDEANPFLTADVTLRNEENVWSVEVNDSSLPPIQIHPYYLNALEEKELKNDEIALIRRHLDAGKWLIRIIDRRKRTLQEIATYLLKREQDYFEGIASAPTPLTMKEVAKALSLSKSTITRAIANKALATPRGLLTFRSFFNQGLRSIKGDISSKQAKDLLLKLIQQEEVPLSDETLSKQLLSQGIQCARRTVTKYRKELKIGSASQRKLRKP